MKFTAKDLVRMLRVLQLHAYCDAKNSRIPDSQRWYEGLEAGYRTAANWIEQHLASTKEKSSHEHAA